MRLTRIDGRWIAVICTGGHDLPLLRKADGPCRRSASPARCSASCRIPSSPTIPFALDPGDTLLLFTDGVPEGRRGREFYGDDRIARVLAKEHDSAAALVDALVADVVGFQDGDTRDDIAVVAIRVPVDAGVSPVPG